MLPSLKTAYTCSPSVQGVGVAWEFLPSLYPGTCSSTSVFHRIRPLAASRQRTWHLRPSCSAAVRKIRSPHTMGDDQPSPGIGVFQATPWVAFHSSGRPDSVEMPCPVGPRKQGQFSASAVAHVRPRSPRLNQKQRIVCVVVIGI